MHKLSEILSWGNICIGDFIKKWYGTKADFVSYGGVDIVKSSKFSPSLKLPPSPKWLRRPSRRVSKVQSYKSAVFIGRLDEQTGILDYIEAVKLIRKKIPDFEFVVIGDGKYREKEINM